MDPQKLLRRVSRGAVKNVSFVDFTRMVEAFGFSWKRSTGSHHLYEHPDIPEIVNLQEDGGQAKPYQVRQFLRLVEGYDLRLERKP